MIKTTGETMPNFLEQLKLRCEKDERLEREKLASLSETEMQAVIDERERLVKEQEAREQEEQRKKQIGNWKRHGVTKCYLEAEWDNFIVNTPEKEKALRNAKTAWETNLLFTGNYGTGKTHLAMCLAKEGAIYRRLSDIFREVRLSYRNNAPGYLPSDREYIVRGNSESEILEYYGDCKLLVIDEIGRQKFTTFEVNLFFDLIDLRWNNVLPTTIITNLTVHEFSELYSAAIIDRLQPVVVRFDWESMRGEKK